jgi:hypothetical protein
MVRLDKGDHSEYVQVIRCDIKLGSVKKYGDEEIEPISEKS